MLYRLFEDRDERTPLLIVSPQFWLEPDNRNMIATGRLHHRTQLLLPMLSLVDMPIQIIENALFTPIQAHGDTLRRLPASTMAKPNQAIAIKHSHD